NKSNSGKMEPISGPISARKIKEINGKSIKIKELGISTKEAENDGFWVKNEGEGNGRARAGCGRDEAPEGQRVEEIDAKRARPCSSRPPS
ncbi:MAG: hypothetical protein QXW19_04815, partial [Candidatus Bathyarchaeia archaeon]